MSPGKRKAARRLLDSWINDIYVRAGSCLQQSRPPCSAGRSEPAPADGADLPRDAAPRDGVPGIRAGITDRGGSADPAGALPGDRACPALGHCGQDRLSGPGPSRGSPASPAPGARCRAGSLRPAERPGSPASCSGLPTEPALPAAPSIPAQRVRLRGKSQPASAAPSCPFPRPPPRSGGKERALAGAAAGEAARGGGRCSRSCWSGLREGGGGPGAAERGTPVGRSPGAPAAGQLRGQAGRGLDSLPGSARALQRR